ncbi:MAG: GntR family transcriptional regulator [Deltaproteobacteria bacterium]|nr:GntR family transcriptional regulator [Deltaproteobacteria bacterium]
MRNRQTKKKSDNQPNGEKNLTREAYQDIRRMIFLKELNPGQKVAYREMAERLGMSLTPVVQALKHMEFMGLVRHEPNRGFFIEHILPQEIEEAYQLREMLETSLLPGVIEGLDDKGQKELKQALDDYLAASRSGSLNLRLAKDINFHMTLAGLSDQHLSIRILRYLFDFLYLRFGQELIFSRPQESAGLEHQAIFDAVAGRDVSAARKAMRRHIRNIRNNALEGMQNRLAEAEQIDF